MDHVIVLNDSDLDEPSCPPQPVHQPDPQPATKKRRTTTSEATAPLCPTDVPPPVPSSIPTPKSYARKFCLQGKKFFLTYPKCTVSPDLALERCKNLPHLSWAIVAQETHKDGTLHLHAVLQFSEKLRLKGLPGLALLDGIACQHGNYKTIKHSNEDLKRTIAYVMKEKNFKCHNINPEEFLEALQNSKSANAGVWIQLAEKLRAGTSLTDVHEWNPGLFAQHSDRIIKYQKWLARRSVPQPTEVLIRVQQDIPTSAGIRLTTWMNANLTVGKTTGRSPRQKQLWLCGAPGIGKTRIRGLLATYLRIYTVPNDEDFYDDWEDDLYDLAVFDEFKGQKPIQWMNSWLDGQPKPIRKKCAQAVKNFNVATIILSNFTPQQCYHKAFERHASQLAPLLDRLEIIDFGSEKIDLEYISETACSDYEKQDCAAGNFDQYLDLPSP